VVSVFHLKRLYRNVELSVMANNNHLSFAGHRMTSFNPVSPGNLFVFITAAHTGSFSETGRRIGKTQSAVSTAINNLEIDLGIELFDRSSYRPSLTRAGTELLHDAEEIVHKLSALQRRAEALATDTDFSIRILSNSYCPLDNVYPVIEKLTREFPQCRPAIDIVSPCAFDAEFRSGNYCLAISTLPAERDLQGVVTTEPIGWIEFCYVVAAGHAMVSEFPLDRRALGRYRQLTLTGICDSLTRPASTQFWMLNDLTSILSLVEKGLGWALLPKQIVSAKIKSGMLTEITCSELVTVPRLPYGTFWKKNMPLSPVAELFLRQFLAVKSEV
jgi:DNA-binding transcriptional LysR family regulator